jgi:hypothetical protein
LKKYKFKSPNYAYGEEIAILNEKIRDSFSLYRSYELFTGWLVNSIAPWQPLPPPNPEIDVNIYELFMNNAPQTADKMLKRFFHTEGEKKI